MDKIVSTYQCGRLQYKLLVADMVYSMSHVSEPVVVGGRKHGHYQSTIQYWLVAYQLSLNIVLHHKF